MKPLRIVLFVFLLVFVGLQLVPRGRNHTNPPVTGSPEWSSPRVEELARRACFDCHSNETKWPWYSNIAPISWRVVEHVEHGRSELNFSEFDKPQRHADEAAREVRKGSMPLNDYLLLHPEARLSEEETQELIAGLEATFGTREPREPSDDGGGR